MELIGLSHLLGTHFPTSMGNIFELGSFETLASTPLPRALRCDRLCSGMRCEAVDPRGGGGGGGRWVWLRRLWLKPEYDTRLASPKQIRLHAPHPNEMIDTVFVAGVQHSALPATQTLDHQAPGRKAVKGFLLHPEVDRRIHQSLSQST